MSKEILEQKVDLILHRTTQLEKAFWAVHETQDDKLCSVQEFEALSGLDQDTLTHQCRQKQLASTKVGGSWYIKRGEYKRLMKEAVTNLQNELMRPGKRDRKLLKHLGYLV